MLTKVFGVLKKLPLLTKAIPLNEKTGGLAVNLVQKFVKLGPDDSAMLQSVVSGLMNSTNSTTLYELVQNKEVEAEMKELGSLFEKTDEIGIKLIDKFGVDSVQRFADCESEGGNALCPHCGDII